MGLQYKPTKEQARQKINALTNEVSRRIAVAAIEDRKDPAIWGRRSTASRMYGIAAIEKHFS